MNVSFPFWAKTDDSGILIEIHKHLPGDRFGNEANVDQT